MTYTTNSTSASPDHACKYCGTYHTTKCPLIKAIDYQEDGVTIKRVEFMTPADYAAPVKIEKWDPGTCYGPIVR